MKHALVTGSSKGVGRGIAEALAAADYTVFVNGRDAARVAQTAAEIGPRAKELSADLSDSAQIHSTVDRLEQEVGGLDLLVLNIGSGRSVPGWDVDVAEMRRVFDINYFSAVEVCHAAMGLLQKRKGNIVFVASIAGCEALGAPVAYSAAKSALISYAKSLSLATAALGIRVNSVSPGNVMFDGSTWDDKLKQNREATEQYIQQNVPLNTFVVPEDIGRAVVFLEASACMTGENLVVDGGQLKGVL